MRSVTPSGHYLATLSEIVSSTENTSLHSKSQYCQ